MASNINFIFVKLLVLSHENAQIRIPPGYRVFRENIAMCCCVCIIDLICTVCVLKKRNEVIGTKIFLKRSTQKWNGA
jgi:hypothetical protein